MRKTRLLSKKIWMLMAILFLGVVSAQAATITYSLTTKVDGRTITGTANLSEGASLLNNMPQDLWRADCTYKFYSDDLLIQEITTSPSSDATVYVDYEFNPTFTISTEGFEVYYYWNAYIASSRFFMYDDKQGHYGACRTNQLDDIDVNQVAYAIYGDAYSLNMKNKGSGKWVTYSETGGTHGLISSSSPMEVGWQWYGSEHIYNSSGHTYSTYAMGSTNDNKLLAYNNLSPNYGPSMGHFMYTTLSYVDSDLRWGSHHILSGGGSGGTTMANASFFFTKGTYYNQYQVTYKIRLADGTWYKDIVKQKGTTEAALAFPTNDYTKINGYEYVYFYKDENFTEKYPDNYKMPPYENTVAYIKEVKYVSTPWMTLVLPFPISSPASYFGEKATISINEYTSVESHLSSNGESFSCKLNFTTKNEIEAYKPYLFKAEKVDQAQLNWALQIKENIDETQLIPIDKTDDTNAAGIKVSMIGVLNPDGYSMPADGLKFFFGSKDNGEGNYTYKFVIPNSAVTIPQFRCYFYVTDERSNASTFALDFDDIELTGICQTTFSTVTNSPIYNINGQKMSATKTSDLPKGLYIVNGKKIIVK